MLSTEEQKGPEDEEPTPAGSSSSFLSSSQYLTAFPQFGRWKRHLPHCCKWSNQNQFIFYIWAQEEVSEEKTFTKKYIFVNCSTLPLLLENLRVWLQCILGCGQHRRINLLCFLEIGEKMAAFKVVVEFGQHLWWRRDVSGRHLHPRKDAAPGFGHSCSRLSVVKSVGELFWLGWYLSSETPADTNCCSIWRRRGLVVPH